MFSNHNFKDNHDTRGKRAMSLSFLFNQYHTLASVPALSHAGCRLQMHAVHYKPAMLNYLSVLWKLRICLPIVSYACVHSLGFAYLYSLLYLPIFTYI